MYTIPIIDVKTDPLDALLAAIGLRLSMLTKSDNEDFAALIEDRQVSIQIGSDANDIARYFVFDNGSFSQYSGKANDPSLSIDFKDSATGVKLLTSGDPAALMTAIQDKDMSMQGDYSLLMWFNQLAKHIVPQVPEQVKPYIEQAKPYIEQAKPYLEQAKPYVYKAGNLAKQAFSFAKQKLNG